jgi:hypothetical protein
VFFLRLKVIDKPRYVFLGKVAKEHVSSMVIFSLLIYTFFLCHCDCQWSSVAYFFSQKCVLGKLIYYSFIKFSELIVQILNELRSEPMYC